MKGTKPDVSEWIQHQRRNNKTTPTWACIFCTNRRIFSSEPSLWEHAKTEHVDRLTVQDGDEGTFRKFFAAESAEKKPIKDGSQSRKPNLIEANQAQLEPPLGEGGGVLDTHGRQGGRSHGRHQPWSPDQAAPLTEPSINDPPNIASVQPQKSQAAQLAESILVSELQGLNINTPQQMDNVSMKDSTENGESQPMDDVSMKASAEGEEGQPKSRRVIDGRSVRLGSKYRLLGAADQDTSSTLASVPDNHDASFTTSSEPGMLPPGMSDNFEIRQLWSLDQETPLIRASFNNPSNVASVQLQKSRAQQLQPKSRNWKPRNWKPPVQVALNTDPPLIEAENYENYDIILQPETRPISQEQLVAEAKGIYAGLVMVEAKCIEVDNKQATLAQADPGAQPKLNNEQWQALIALHRTLLHEHHDFFLASQHPSASPALRRLASKYAMPARMWRHGIHSFLEILRHQLPASLDHMLAFNYLAYSMMALLYETVPAFEDTWIECLGDLGRYRMAIEDDDIRDREVWTGVARHWYSKASDKAPTAGRLYHHLAILARPNALQQLFYYSKSLCIVMPFTSARESILTLFDPVLNAENRQGRYRLPPLDTSFVKAHGLLFTNKNMEKFEPTMNDFLGLLDNQIGRVTRKFMEQGYHIAVANIVAMLGFASKDNVLMKALPSIVKMEGSPSEHTAQSLSSFRNAQRLSNSTIRIVLQRIGDPNVLPFIHVTLVFMFNMSRHPGAIRLLQEDFPWDLLSIMLNTLLASYGSPSRIENDKFPLPEKDNGRPFPEDFAVRGLLWTDGYFPEEWFSNEKIDEEEKYHELASMTAERKERILWLSCRIANVGHGLNYDGKRFSATGEPQSPIVVNVDSNSKEEWSYTGEDEEDDLEEDDLLDRLGHLRLS